jgi:hypothetical protein
MLLQRRGHADSKLDLVFDAAADCSRLKTEIILDNAVCVQLVHCYRYLKMVSMPAGREACLHKTRSNRDKGGCTIRMGSKESGTTLLFVSLGVSVWLVSKNRLGEGGVTPQATSANY